MSARSKITGWALVFAALAVGQAGAEDPPNRLEHFGFTLVDVGWDDPLDDDDTTSFLDEVAPFSTLADVLVVAPEQRIGDQLDAFARHELRAVLHVSEIFFTADAGREAPSGNTAYRLRPDYAQRWDAFVAGNELAKRLAQLGAFYVGEEPTWNGISAKDLTLACDHLKASLSDVPVLVIEAAPALAALTVPRSVDWIGFDHYFLKQGANAKVFREELALLKHKRSSDRQRIVLVPDAHFIAEVHGHFGVTRKDLAAIATSYLDLAREDTDVVAVLAYFWPGGFDHPKAMGTRQMPKVARVYARFGRSLKTSQARKPRRNPPPR